MRLRKPELWWWKYKAQRFVHCWRDMLAQRAADLLPKRVIYFATIRLWARVTVAVEGMPHTEHWSRTNVPTLEIGEALTRWEYFSRTLQLSPAERDQVDVPADGTMSAPISGGRD